MRKTHSMVVIVKMVLREEGIIVLSGPGPTVIPRDIVVFFSFCTKVREQGLKLQDWTLNYRTGA